MIDWFTVAAQIINFLILVALLKHFLYGRIVAAMEQREQEIAARWEEAHQQRDEAADELESAREKQRQIDHQREEMLAQARDDVEKYRQELTVTARTEVNEMQARWAEAIREERDAFLRDLRRRSAEKVCEIARDTLDDLADARLEQLMVRNFLRQLAELGDAEKQTIVQSVETGQGVAIVQSAHPLSEELQATVAAELHKEVLPGARVEFEVEDDLICGIALRTNSQKLAWNVRDYFMSMEQELRTALDEEVASRKLQAPEPASAGE